MRQASIPAVYMRGGTSRALFFHERDLPPRTQPGDNRAWDRVFTAALGSPDPNGRQLDGMGGGISSLSKIAVIAPASRPDADIDFTFAQVGVKDRSVGYRGNCGNISAAVGPFAVDEGLVCVQGNRAEIRIHNTNTGKIILSRFAIEDGQAAVDGDFVLPGIAGSGAEIELVFTDLGGATTGKLLPTGYAVDQLALPPAGTLQVSLIDAANPVVFLEAKAIGLSGTETTETLTANGAAMMLFEDIRVAAAVRMGLVSDPQKARTEMKSLPIVCLISAPQSMTDSGGNLVEAEEMDVLVRMISSGQPHKATPLTAAMCLAVAVQIPGTVPYSLARHGNTGKALRIGHPGGILPVSARVRVHAGQYVAEEATVFRTARRLMDGRVYLSRAERNQA